MLPTTCIQGTFLGTPPWGKSYLVQFSQFQLLLYLAQGYISVLCVMKELSSIFQNLLIFVTQLLHHCHLQAF